ncbi:MAG: hypothetical protein OQL17_12840 [Sedimenticola sp.]|nr:hypothetical protein [Sedimenticola sp.]
MQGFLLGTLSLVLFSSLVTAEGRYTPPYAGQNGNIWRPDDRAADQQAAPDTTQGQYQTPNQIPYGQPDTQQGTYPYQQLQPYPGNAQQAQPEPYGNYGYQESYDSGYYAAPQGQTGYWGENGYLAAPGYGYPSGYYQAQPYSYPYVYETAPAVNSYAPPPEYAPPQGYGYNQGYYAPMPPAQEQAYEEPYPSGYGAGYGYPQTQTPNQTAPQDYQPQQVPAAPYMSGQATQPAYQQGNVPVPQGMAQPQYPTDDQNAEWQPNAPQRAANIQQQASGNNGILVNGAPAVFRPWTAPDDSAEQKPATE